MHARQKQLEILKPGVIAADGVLKVQVLLGHTSASSFGSRYLNLFGYLIRFSVRYSSKILICVFVHAYCVVDFIVYPSWSWCY